MNKALSTAAICCLFTACAGSPSDKDAEGDIVVTKEALDVTRPSMLTRKQGRLASIQVEGNQNTQNTRQYDTNIYYNLQISPTDSQGGTIKQFLGNLTNFKNRFQFAGREQVAYYYNRGDLGIGREMHCVDNLQVTGSLFNTATVACYVKNFAAGDDNTEFTFGQSADTAFRNMNNNHPFATVAMVYRDQRPDPNKVFYIVYDKNDQLQYFAALDRTGILYATGANQTSTPGVNFNNNIPTNCMACHGGSYDVNRTASGNLFLPFDLDRFEYQKVPGRTRADQLTAFKHLNEMVWRVATRSGYDPGASNPGWKRVADTLDLWYHNSAKQNDNRLEVFENDFDSAVAPAGWSYLGGFYNAVLRPTCGSCHLTNSVPIDVEPTFRNFAPTAVSDLCAFQMPHSLQALREFWMSSKPAMFESYLRFSNLTQAADQLHACGPRNVATLDPQFIVNATRTMN